MFSLGFFGSFFMVKSNNKILKIQENVKIYKKKEKENGFKFFNSEKFVICMHVTWYDGARICDE